MKAFCYADYRIKRLVLSEAKKYRQTAFDITSVGKILNRSRLTIYYYIENDFILPLGKSGPRNSHRGKWWFTPDQVIELRDIIHQNSMNAKAPVPLPTREEVRAMVRTRKMLYIQEGDQFVPVWRAENW